MKPLKTYFLLTLIGFLLFIPSSIHAQDFPIDQETNKITYTEVVQLANSTVSQKELYSIVREWFAKSFNSANYVLQMDDKELGKLIGKGGLPLITTAYLTDSHVLFTISVFVKEGRYKYTITDFVHESFQGEEFSGGALEDVKPDCIKLHMLKKGWLQVKQQTAMGIGEVIADLKKVMAEGMASDDNW